MARPDDDDDDRPRRPKKKAKKPARSRPPWLLIGGIGALLAVVAVVVVVVALKGRKDRAPNDRPGADAPAAGATGGERDKKGPLPAGDMAGLIGAVEGLKPPVLKPAADAPGLAFRLPVANEYEAHHVVLPPQPSDYFALVFVNREQFVYPQVTVVDRRTAQPLGKSVNLLPEFQQRPRPPIGASRPDLSADGTLLSTHKYSTNDKWAGLPVEVWDVASGKKVKEIAGRPGTLWQGWVAPDRLMTVGKAARFDVWSYPAGANEGGNGSQADEPDRLFGSVMTAGTHYDGTPRFAITADRKAIALPRSEKEATGNRAYYSILDAATGREIGRLPTISGNGLLSMIAFSPDGTKLAYLAEVGARVESRSTALFVADARTGAAAGQPIPVKDAWAGNTLATQPLQWWGPGLLVHPGSNGFNAIDPATGRVLAKLKFSEGGMKMLPTSGDGRLWVNFPPTQSKAYSGSYICAFDPTPEIRAANGSTFLLTPDGIKPEPR